MFRSLRGFDRNRPSVVAAMLKKRRFSHHTDAVEFRDGRYDDVYENVIDVRLATGVSAGVLEAALPDA